MLSHYLVRIKVFAQQFRLFHVCHEFVSKFLELPGENFVEGDTRDRPPAVNICGETLGLALHPAAGEKAEADTNKCLKAETCPKVGNLKALGSKFFIGGGRDWQKLPKAL